MRVGLISDTHGLLRPEILTHFEGVDLILHAGDVGNAGILAALQAVAPVHAVYGNTDGWELRHRLPPEVRANLDGTEVVLLHGDRFGTPTPATLHGAWPDADVVVFGHTHRPACEAIGAALFVNPGAAGAARFNLKPTVAILDTGTVPATVRFIELA